MNSKPNIFIAAGVTGGHILPMLYVAEKLKVNANIIFIGTGRELEKKLIEGKGYKLLTLNISGIHKLGIKGLISFLLKCPMSLLTTIGYFLKYKPKVVIGGGAYVSIVPGFCGYLFKVPVHIHEAEKKPGIANNFLSYFATSISVAYKETKFKSKKETNFTGQPINPKIEEAIEEFKNKKREAKPKNILILGGSQGSRIIDKAVLSVAPLLKKENVNIWHQCWYEDVLEVTNIYSKLNMEVKVSAFIDDMLEAYRFSDLIIARSGAGLTKEIGLLKIPSILIPLPGSSANNHQFENAKILEELGLASIVLQDEELEVNLVNTLVSMFSKQLPNELNQSSFTISDVGVSSRIAEIVLGQIK